MRKLESIYTALGWDRKGIQEISELVTERNTDSRSLRVQKGESTVAALKRVFGIQAEVFEEKFQQACSGSGQEERRILTLHSSSLCALAFFSHITPENPQKLFVAGVGECVFTEAIFEYQNCVIDGANPSNMDVTLLGEYQGKNVILFLESKFSEYIIGVQRKLYVNRAYLNEKISKPIYEHWQWSIEENPSEKEFCIWVSDVPSYLGGLKQMVSHYVGVRKFEKGIAGLRNGGNSGKYFYNVTENLEKQKVQEKLRTFAIERETIIILGSVIFDVYENDTTHTELQEYEGLYEKLMNQIVMISADSGSDIRILTKSYTYQELFKNKVDWPTPEIHDVYFHK